MKPRCGWTPGGMQIDKQCPEDAAWFGTMVVGAWVTFVGLCDQHARTFSLMTTALMLTSSNQANVPMMIGVTDQVRNLKDFELYQLPQQIWSCSECGRAIVRSLDSGEWVLANGWDQAKMLERGEIKPDLAHEHTPG
jgi:hypothetical protein